MNSVITPRSRTFISNKPVMSSAKGERKVMNSVVKTSLYDRKSKVQKSRLPIVRNDDIE